MVTKLHCQLPTAKLNGVQSGKIGFQRPLARLHAQVLAIHNMDTLYMKVQEEVDFEVKNHQQLSIYNHKHSEKYVCMYVGKSSPMSLDLDILPVKTIS